MSDTKQKRNTHYLEFRFKCNLPTVDADKKVAVVPARDLKQDISAKDIKNRQKRLVEQSKENKGQLTDKPEVRIKDYLHQNFPATDSVNTTLMRTLDNSNIKESADTSLSSHMTSKKKLISLLLERSRMSPTHEEESLMKMISEDEKNISSNEQSLVLTKKSSKRILNRKVSKENTSIVGNPPNKSQAHQQSLKKITMSATTVSSKENIMSPHKLRSKVPENSVKQSSVSSKNTPVTKQSQSVKNSPKHTPKPALINPSKKPIDAKFNETSQIQKNKEIGKGVQGAGSSQSSSNMNVLREQSRKNSKIGMHQIEKESENRRKPSILTEEMRSAEANKNKDHEETVVRPFKITETESVIVPHAISSGEQRELELEETVRSILKPHPCIQQATHAILCLLSGLSNLVPKEVVNREYIDWSELKGFLQSPIFLINQINSFREICQSKQIEITSVARAHSLLVPTNPEDGYSSEAYDALKGYVKAAINYFLETNKQYTLENLHQYQPNLNELKQSQIVDKPAATVDKPAMTQTKAASKAVSKKEPQSPVNANSCSARAQNSRSTKSLVKVPANLTPPRSNIKQVSAKSVTPKHTAAQKEVLHEKKQQPKLFTCNNASLPRPVTQSTVDLYGKLSQEQAITDHAKKQVGSSRYSRDSKFETPEPKRKPNLNKSYDEVRRKSLTESETKAGHADLQRKIEKVLDDKSVRSASQTPKRRFSRAVNNPEDKSFLEELAERLQLEEETQDHKKVARNYKQKTTKLLLEHDKQRKLDAKMEQAAQEELDREFSEMERRNLEEIVNSKQKEERDYMLDIFKDKQLFRIVEKELKKEREEDELYHELMQNFEHHEFKKKLGILKRISHQEILKQRLLKMLKDRQFKRQKAEEEKTAEMKEIKDRRQNQALWKKMDALKDRVQAEEEYLLLERLINGK